MADAVEELLADLERAIEELTAPYRRDPAAWTRGRPGKWNAGQHVEHVGKMLAIGAAALERGAAGLREGRMGRRPWRDPLQAWFVRTVTGDRFPRGGRSPASAQPPPAPDRDRVLEGVTREARRYRTLTAALAPEERARLWVRNPFAPWLRWHYTLAEMVRVQTTHARHHARLATEAAPAA